MVQKWIINGNHDRRQYSLTLNKYHQIYNNIVDKVPSIIKLNMIYIDSSELKNHLLRLTKNIIQVIQKSIYQLIMKKKTQIDLSLQQILIKTSKIINSCQQLVSVQNQIDIYKRIKINKLNDLLIDTSKWIVITLYNTLYPILKQDLQAIYETSINLKNIYHKLEIQETKIYQSRIKLEKETIYNSLQLNNKIIIFIQGLKKLKQFGSNLLKDTAIEFLIQNRNIINKFKQQLININQRQNLLGLNLTLQIKLQQWDNNLKPFEELWFLVKNYMNCNQIWTKQNIMKQNSNEIEIKTKLMFKNAIKLSKNIIINSYAPDSSKIAQDLAKDIKNFDKYISIIATFSNPGIKTRHLQSISSLIGGNDTIIHSNNLNLNKVLALGVGEHLEMLAQINQNATKQYVIQSTLNQIQKQWAYVQLEMKNYKELQTKIITGASIQEVQSLLDEHSLKVITMKGSVYAKIFEEKLQYLQDWLNYTSELLDYSVRVQSVWMYLQPVMTSPDILKHLAVEGTKFRQVDTIWSATTSIYASKQLINQITKDRSILKKLKDSHHNLEIIQKGLNSYLESKRLSFPRFFFLSNDQLLEILSQTKNPIKVQPHLKKCFQGIAKLQFQQGKFIQGMYSFQGQYVNFTNKINTTLTRGNVDEWLIEVQNRMIENIKRQIKECHLNMQNKKRNQCLLNHCSMAVLTVQMTRWTNNIENNIHDNTLNEGTIHNKQLLNEIIQMIKNPLLNKIEILTLQCLIILSVHGLDIIKQLLQFNITQINHFKWQSQLRYYIKSIQQVFQTSVQILNAICSFNYQYLGNTSRLVITPLTDRCYRTLCSAIHLNYGGAPQGPAGTGKTQTVKDLAKALACQCVVFNCSDGLDYKAMGKFFKGLAASGAWSCFDEFNRINLEVLSVVAQQILCIQTAKSRNQQTILFEDIELPLKKNANCFITMNPGYAGRSELPDNLKALFRSVAMMIPDYSMIAEISLYSYGFENARNLARKIVTTYKLCSQQLSTQSHYDYGMRAVKSVLISAGTLKHKFKNIEESSLILKAINDVNIGKFLSFDIPLFQGITNDLFPQIKPPIINYQELVNIIKKQFKSLKMEITDYVMNKIIQIYDMILVRHGLMVVGYPFSGKSTALEILAKSLGQCQDSMNQFSVQICKINPKSITMQQLYGYFDEISRQWFDGILPVHFRTFATSNNNIRKWLHFDGPVDALWIQNMNTVLDDNRKLCLSSGEIIQMNKSMSLIFEPMDLLAASPATVSRCGMIYLEPASLGYQLLISSWLQNNQWLKDDLEDIFKQFFQLITTLYTNITHLKTICYTSIFSLLTTFFNILDQIIKPIKTTKQQSQRYEQIDEKTKFNIVGYCFIFAIIWSFGASLVTDSHKQFDLILKRLFISQIGSGAKKRKLSYPEKGNLFDYLLQIQQNNLDCQWIQWIDKIQSMKYSKSIQIHEIIVKTADSVKYNYMLHLYYNLKKSTILCGSTGTGKTTIVKNISIQLMKQKEVGFIEIVMSSRTTCNQVQQQIQTKLDKKGNKAILGPKNTQQILIFVDDLNMPIKELYGAQPPIQLLRQLQDQQGFYDFKDKEKIFKRIIGTTFIYSMNNNNNDITPRFLRHTNLICVTNFNDEILMKIFGTILNISFDNHSEQKAMSILLKYSIEVYNQCLKKLLPTPTKLHYIFNLRDLWKLIIGICRADKNKINSENIGRLWGHEIRRIFMDRLLPEQKYIIENMIKSIGKKWGKNMKSVYFTDLLSTQGMHSYQEIADIEKINLTLNSILKNYNIVSDKPMDLVLFQYALEHILIVLRIIRQPKGNALLIGLGGSGRQSFANLASFISEYTVVTLQITKNYHFGMFRQDLKKMFIEIGINNKNVSFIFKDNHIKEQQFLQDINNLLNINMVPNLFNSQQKLDICEKIRKDAVQNIGHQISLDQIYDFFLQRIKNQLRLILCFSPIGQAFRGRLRMFPSLINCTTIDWYDEWPQQGLLSVASKFLEKTNISQKSLYIKMLSFLHVNIKKWTILFKNQLHRKLYITPTSYIQSIANFKIILTQQRKQIKQSIFKYQNGYEKILQTEKDVQVMKISLQEMKPSLKQAAQETIIKMQMVKVQKEEADTIMLQIQGEENIVLEAVEDANSIKEQCQKELAIALPQLKAAENALLILDKSSLTELKSMMNPPPAVRYVMQGLCLLIDPNPKQKIKNEKTLKMETDWWTASIRNLANPKLLNDLVNFNKQDLSEITVNNLGKFLNDPNNKQILSIQNVAKSSTACECIIQWVNGIYNYYYVNKKVKPKKQSLQIAEKKVNQLNEKLKFKRKQLDSANEKVDELNYELQWAQKNKQKLQKQYEKCEISLYRAQIIISSLSGEKGRWLQLSNLYKKQQEQIDINIFLASVQVSYLGPFTKSFRNRIIEQWKQTFIENGLNASNKSSLVEVLGQPIQIRQWNLNGLPYDDFSVENVIIMYNSRKWPLMIDPQDQANKWLKKQELIRKLKIFKLSDNKFIRNLENCIQFGTPVLIEGIAQTIDASLNPILQKQTYKKGATTYLKMGQNVLMYSNNFQLYLTTKLRNPHYLPQVCTQVVIINFMITQQGLSDQILSLLITKQRPQLQIEKQKLVLESSENKKNLKILEDEILQILNNSASILEDQKAIDILSASKEKSTEIFQKQTLAQVTEERIDKARLQYRQVANDSSKLFFVVSDLVLIDPMYQYSLNYFTQLFAMAITKSPKSSQLQIRLQGLKCYFLESLFKNISRSLFQKDRLTLSILIAFRMINCTNQSLRFLLSTTVPLGHTVTHPKPSSAWISQKMWQQISILAQSQPFHHLISHFQDPHYLHLMHDISQLDKPLLKPFPTPYVDLQYFQKMMLYKCLRPQKMVEFFTEFVSQVLGEQFTKSIAFDLNNIYTDSNNLTPLLFILSSGTDPLVSVMNFSETLNNHLETVSLGQGQGPIAQRIIRQNIEKGGWVVLQNCHLAISWMPSLERIIEQLSSGENYIHKDFRMWLTSYPSEQFPQVILQKSIKVTNQPPKGLKNNLMNSFLFSPAAEQSFFNSSLHGKIFKKLLYSLCFFHSVVQERRKYGVLGWNISYDFTDSDLRISCWQLKNYIDNMTNLPPFEALKYLIAQCNYGGRVTDQNDRRLLETLISDYMNTQIIQNEHYNFGHQPQYILPKLQLYQDYLQYISGLTEVSSPELIGLHPNAIITKDINQSYQLLQSLMLCSLASENTSQQMSYHQQVTQIICQIQKNQQLQSLFNLKKTLLKYPVLYSQSMNTVLNQEINRYNGLLIQINQTMQELLKAIKGEIIMTVDLQAMCKSLYDGKVPDMWLKKSYPSLKFLGSYIIDLKKRIIFFRDWISSGIPKQFWISGFFFTQSFLTGVLQNYSREVKIPVDELAFQFIFSKEMMEKAKLGVNVYGLFIQGANWNYKTEKLIQSQNGQLFVQCPNIYLKPTKSTEIIPAESYDAPMYKTALRKGILSTTGHSTNFVMMVKIPTEENPNYWVKRGVALITEIKS